MGLSASLPECVNLAGRGLVIHQVRLNFTDDAHIPWLMKAILVLAQIFLRHLIDVLVSTFFRHFYDLSSHGEPTPGIAEINNVKTDFWSLLHVQLFLSPFERIDQNLGAIKVNPDRSDVWSAICHERG